jgi:hypothetical protein
MRSSPVERVELAPNLAAARREVPVMVLVFTVLTALGIMIGVPTAAVVGLDLAVVLFIVALFIGARNLRVFADGEGAGWVDRLGRPQRFLPGTRMQFLRTLGGTSQLFIAFVAPDGHRLFSSSARAWNLAQLQTLCARAGIEIDGSTDKPTLR